MPTPKKLTTPNRTGLKARAVNVPLCPYQDRWVKDSSRFKIAVKARRIGFTFATTLEIALDAISRRTRWLIISRTQDTAKEALKEIKNHFEALRAHACLGDISERPTELFFEGMRVHQFVIELPNGSEITAMTAHPDAARGFGGNVFLDEHGFHRDSEELWKGAAAAVLRGHRLIVVSTPHYQTGNYYRLAREADLVSGRAPLESEPRAKASGPLPFGRGSDKQSLWSAHWVDIHTAAPQLAKIGVPINLAELRQLAGDDETWNQEFCCQFLSAAEMWIPLELIAAARSPQANLEWDPEAVIPSGSEGSALRSLYIGADIGRKRDRTAIWIDEVLRSPVQANGAYAGLSASGDLAICRGVITLERTSFEQQFNILSELIAHPRVRRASIDQTGIGMALVERLQEKFGWKVEGITFTRENKEEMSIRVRRRFEERLDRIPDGNVVAHQSLRPSNSAAVPGMRPATAAEIERDLAAIKRQATSSGNLRFDAERTDASHADIYWAKALADLAADSAVAAVSLGADPWEAARGNSSPQVGTGREERPSIWDENRDLAKQEMFA